MWRLGIIQNDAGEVLARPKMMQNEMQASQWIREIEKMSPACTRLSLAPQTISGKNEVYIDAYFHDGCLEKLLLNIGDDEALRLWGPNRPAGTMLNFYKSWIQDETWSSSPVSYAWGSISADEDHWTLDASIFFGYKRK